MAKPKSKEQLLSQSNANFNRLKDFIEQLQPDQQTATFKEGFMNRNIRDVLSHLHHWHLMMLSWYKIGMTGQKPDMPAKGYTWKMTPQLNQFIWEKYQPTPLHKSKKLLLSSFDEVQKIIQSHSDEELFEKKRYKWTGSTSMGAYLISATSSHYDWAYKLIKKAMILPPKVQQ